MKSTLFYDIFNEILSSFHHVIARSHEVATKQSRNKVGIASVALRPRNDIANNFLFCGGFDASHAPACRADGTPASLPDLCLVPPFGNSHASGFYYPRGHSRNETRPGRRFSYRPPLRS